MVCYKELYGDDADGNRGVMVINYEVEADDVDDVVEALYDGFLEDSTTGTQTIMLYCAGAGEDVEVEVEIDDYIENLIEKADEDEDIKADEDLHLWFKNFKNEFNANKENLKALKIAKEEIKETIGGLK